MRKLLRVFVLIEALSTLAGGVLVLVAPQLAVGMLVAEPLDAVAGAMAAQAGGAWVALGLLLLAILALRPGDGRALRLILGPVLIGDLVHIGAIAWAVHAHGSWNASAAGVAVYTALLFAYRTAIAFRPTLLLGED